MKIKIIKLQKKIREINRLDISPEQKKVLLREQLPDVEKPLDERIEKINDFVGASKFDGPYRKAFAVHNDCIDLDAAYLTKTIKYMVDDGDKELLQAEITFPYKVYTKMFMFATKELNLPRSPKIKTLIHLELHSFNDR